MPTDPFIHLHLHTEYSLLDSSVRIAQLIQKAKQYQMPAVAMTDKGNLFGAIDFYKNATQAGIKPILGCEIYLTQPGGSMKDRNPDLRTHRKSHLTLLAQNNKGWSNLMKLVTKAHLDDCYYETQIDEALLSQHCEGLICLSGDINQLILSQQLDAARNSVGDLVDIFGGDNFFLEVQDHGLAQQHACTKQMVKFAKQFNLGLVATNGVLFLDQKDYDAHDVLTCIRTGTKQNDEVRLRYSPEAYFKTSEEMSALFKEVPEAIQNTRVIADRCKVSIESDFGVLYKTPRFYPPRDAKNENKVRELCAQGLHERYGRRADTDNKLRERFDYEIKIITTMGHASYLLIFWDLVKWAHEKSIPIVPRGTAAGSLVNYILGITDICPMRFGLIFQHFMNPERIFSKAIELDICQTRREEAIGYLRQRYGDVAISKVITFGEFKAKDAVRDIARVMALSCDKIDSLASMIPNNPNITFKVAERKNPGLKELIHSEPINRKIWEYTNLLEGLKQGQGIHPADIIIGDQDLSAYIPLTRSNKGEIVSQFNTLALVESGLMKMSLRGVKTLTVITDTVGLIKKTESGFQLDTSELSDKASFDLIKRGDTAGVFLMESNEMMDLCKRFDATRIEDVCDLIAMSQAGQADKISNYIDRKRGDQGVEYLHPLLEKVCGETYGLLIYQEQVLRIISILCGINLGPAGFLLEELARKKTETRERNLFVKDCANANQIPSKKAHKLFDYLEKSAVKLSNKSHCVAYAVLTYQTAYLKANYPLEFKTALLPDEN